MCAGFASCQNEVDVRVAVGDEALYAVEQPAAFFLAVCCLEHYALQVGTCVGLGEVHTHCLAGTNARNILLALLLVAELIESLYTVLKAPYVLEAGVGCGNNLRSHRVGSNRHVETAVTARH